jgi:hypothetical protein
MNAALVAHASEVLASTWQLADDLMVKYADGGLTLAGADGAPVSVQLGYPPAWLRAVGFEESPNVRLCGPAAFAMACLPGGGENPLDETLLTLRATTPETLVAAAPPAHTVASGVLVALGFAAGVIVALSVGLAQSLRRTRAAQPDTLGKLLDGAVEQTAATEPNSADDDGRATPYTPFAAPA